ncbi:Ig-like domain-containing protein [Myxococcus qinghaiensis]|uniref:Ig-like domain-containing protein n=1 Tax=Myxococcus qinghaiensis TaxID=2906758 RepID=UPI0020A7E3F5|nr:Ig-like domain-containing protein [Myxococcus qinghaiensis]MCP3169510.1 Ig-like domain-containing protein [Myxococcus qinghaiensis]
MTAVLVTLGTGCGDECVDQFDCRADNGQPDPGKEWACNDGTCEQNTINVPTPDSGTPDSGTPDSGTPDSGTPDSGTPDAGVTCTPACAAGELCDVSSGTGVCKTCRDSATGINQDEGCSAAAPVCDTTGAGGKGVCTACRDTAQGGAQDLGCSAATPVCDTAASNGVGVCKACTDSALGNAQDNGCSPTAPACDPAANSGAGACKACVDSATGTGQDVGCSATAPICDAAANNGAGACKVCVDSQTSPDLGCSSPTNICDPTGNNGAGECKVCNATEGCQGGQTCNATGTACEGCADNASCAPETPVCRTDTTPTVCVECTSDNTAHCDATKPVCNANFLCGCSDNVQCAAVPDSARDFCDPLANNGRGQCEVCLTNSECANADPSKPICNNKTACVQCLTNANCGITQVCNTTTFACESSGPTPADTTAQIQAILTAAPGTINQAVTGAFVTAIKAAAPGQAATEPVGFFIQAEPNGPAVFVSDAAALAQVAVGDRVNLTATAKAEPNLQKTVTAVSDFSRISQGHPVKNLATQTPAGLAVDVSGANDLVTALGNYESEIVSISGTIANSGGGVGAGFTGFQFTTTGMTAANNNFRLRMPIALGQTLDIVQGCTFTFVGPMWRFDAAAQPSASTAADLTLSCVAPKLLSAAASSLTTVTLTFDRNISEASLTNLASQFTFTEGLTATAAQVTGKQVFLTTSTQTAGTSYTLTVANTVKDTAGGSVVAPNNTDEFKGFRTAAVVRITEVQPNMANSLDLVELQVLTAGTTDGLVLQQDVNAAVVLLTFPDVNVAQGDIIVVHINEAAAYQGETTAKDQFPKATVAANYDNAWDFKGGATGITFSSRILLVKDAAGTIQDAVSFARTSGTPPGAFPGNLQAIQAAGQWLPADCGGAPCSTTSTPTAAQVSADWTTIPSTAASVTPETDTIRRVSATDTNAAADWAVGPQSWGVANP